MAIAGFKNQESCEAVKASYSEVLQINVGGHKVIGLLANQSLFTYQNSSRECIFGLTITYLNNTETGFDIDEAFALDSSYFRSNYEMHLDFEAKKIYFRGMNVFENENPIPDPRIDPSSFPLWAIICLSVVGLLALGVVIWCFTSQKKRKLATSLASYQEL